MAPEHAIAVRPLEAADTTMWTTLRSRLWPDADVADLRSECTAFTHGTALPHIAAVFVASEGSQTIVGFIELAIRAFADGCESMPVPHVEGWYVEERVRRSGTGRALMRAAEEWARSLGYAELASDTEIENVASIHAHERCGFVETERLVKLRKALD